MKLSILHCEQFLWRVRAPKIVMPILECIYVLFFLYCEIHCNKSLNKICGIREKRTNTSKSIRLKEISLYKIDSDWNMRRKKKRLSSDFIWIPTFSICWLELTFRNLLESNRERERETSAFICSSNWYWAWRIALHMQLKIFLPIYVKRVQFCI